ncbi:hypothetical protein [Dactylosporangium sp. NPDC051541]|uniref:hypothetical protein n=1 Tax=Dactylosporangium sp. NPDC051541 TaxID=3363977 RepID=UPI0037BB2662
MSGYGFLGGLIPARDVSLVRRAAATITRTAGRGPMGRRCHVLSGYGFLAPAGAVPSAGQSGRRAANDAQAILWDFAGSNGGTRPRWAAQGPGRGRRRDEGLGRSCG